MRISMRRSLGQEDGVEREGVYVGNERYDPERRW